MNRIFLINHTTAQLCKGYVIIPIHYIIGFPGTNTLRKECTSKERNDFVTVKPTKNPAMLVSSSKMTPWNKHSLLLMGQHIKTETPFKYVDRYQMLSKKETS